MDAFGVGMARSHIPPYPPTLKREGWRLALVGHCNSGVTGGLLPTLEQNFGLVGVGKLCGESPTVVMF
jgi:hypothetical protein